MRVQGLSALTTGQVGVALVARYGLRIAASLSVGAGMVWLLLHRLSAIEPADVAAAFVSLAPQAWALALVATTASFWAVGRYDAVVHRHFATRQPEGQTRLAGICAISVSQMIGLGVISGAILRWRMLPDTTLLQATRLTAAVALSFLAAWAMVTSVVLVALPQAPFKTIATATLLAGLGLVLVSLAAPRLGRLTFRWPNGFTLSRLFGLCVIDTLAAALAFHALCPPDIALPFTVLLPAFLLALGAGLISGAPGGMGAFEVTLLALLPFQPAPDLLAAVLAWRMVYFVLPAILGAALAIRGPKRGYSAPIQPAAALAMAARAAEVQLLRQGEHRLVGHPDTGVWLAGRTSHCLVALFDIVCGPPNPAVALQTLTKAAHDEGRVPVLYKVPPRLAAVARQSGQQVVVIAREAVLHPARYEVAKSCRSGLRRKLRRAEAAGICISPATAAPDWPALDRVASAWARHHGTERGFSMGRYDHRYVQGQRLYVATLNDQPVAFVTFHDGPQEWVLDLMRHVPDVPDGTMHLLIQTAIDDAKRAGIARLSLAAVSESAFGAVPAAALRALTTLGTDAGAGLARFKSAFAPQWEPRYLCLPNRAALPLVLAELARAIHHPAALPPRPEADSFPPTTRDDAKEYAFASVPAAWQDG